VLGDAPRPYPLLELGAGTGYATLRLAELLPAIEIVTVERSAAMRSVLNARLALDPDARRRVTVVADDFFGASLPPLWSAAVLIHFVCQIDPPRRTQLWPMLREHLAPGAVALLDRCFGPKSADAAPAKLTGE
jgi:predicted O-methyltransferase YrrM